VMEPLSDGLVQCCQTALPQRHKIPELRFIFLPHVTD
jgi:hypothetical protein